MWWKPWGSTYQRGTTPTMCTPLAPPCCCMSQRRMLCMLPDRAPCSLSQPRTHCTRSAQHLVGSGPLRSCCTPWRPPQRNAPHHRRRTRSVPQLPARGPRRTRRTKAGRPTRAYPRRRQRTRHCPQRPDAYQPRTARSARHRCLRSHDDRNVRAHMPCTPLRTPLSDTCHAGTSGAGHSRARCRSRHPSTRKCWSAGCRRCSPHRLK